MVKIKRYPKLSDHAVLRFAERKYGLDVAKLKAEMLTPDVKAAIMMGAKKVRLDGIDFYVAPDGTVQTVWVNR